MSKGYLPKGVPGQYWHKKKVLVDKRTYCCRFLETVIVSKTFDYNSRSSFTTTVFSTNETVEAKGSYYGRVHASFQSTSSCNFSIVNSISRCSFSVWKKDRGQKDKKGNGLLR